MPADTGLEHEGRARPFGAGPEDRRVAQHAGHPPQHCRSALPRGAAWGDPVGAQDPCQPRSTAHAGPQD